MTGVADRMPERLAHLVYLIALVPENGQSVFDLLPPAMRQRFAEAAQSHGEGWRVPAPPFEDDPVIAAFARGRHVHCPLRMFTDPVDLGPTPDLPRSYIWCTEDQAGLAGVADLMQSFAARSSRTRAGMELSQDALDGLVRDLPEVVIGDRDSLERLLLVKTDDVGGGAL